MGLKWQHRERIYNKLQEFLSTQEARAAATDIYNLTLDIDDEIGRILKDPVFETLYEYDGQLFTCRCEPLFHVAFNGIHLLEWMTDSVIESLLRRMEKHLAVEWLRDEMRRHVWVAKIRRMNWEEFHTLGLLPPETLDAELQKSRDAEDSPSAMSPEQQEFFHSFEEQMIGKFSPA